MKNEIKIDEEFVRDYNDAMENYCKKVSEFYNNEIKFYKEELEQNSDNMEYYDFVLNNYEEFKKRFKNGENLSIYYIEDYGKDYNSYNGEYPDVYEDTIEYRKILNSISITDVSKKYPNFHFKDYYFDINE